MVIFVVLYFVGTLSLERIKVGIQCNIYFVLVLLHKNISSVRFNPLVTTLEKLKGTFRIVNKRIRYALNFLGNH